MDNKELEVFEYFVDSRPDFQREVKRLIRKKKFNTLQKQIDELMSDLERGQFNGTCLTVSDVPVPHKIYKLRLPNPDAGVGKSDGYRVVYVVITEHKIVVLLTIYYKKEQATITDHEIKLLLEGYLMSLLIEESDDEESDDT